MSEKESLPEALGKYRVERILGRGAMGVVYKAHDPSIDRDVALKTIRTDLLAEDERAEWLARFRQEARAAGRCLHPNIVTVFDFSDQGDTPFIVMEYVDGWTLNYFLKKMVRLEQAAALQIMSQVLEALEFAHRFGIVHRDIKPANIMLLRDSRVKVADFGISRLDSLSRTQSGVVVGTPSYMSPEQFTGATIDARSDCFSAGVVLYELLCGRKPFQGRSMTEVMYQVVHAAPQDMREINSDIPPQLGAAVLKALAKAPEARFQSAREFADALTVAARPGAARAPEPAADSAEATVFAPAGHEPVQSATPRTTSSFADSVLTGLSRDLALYVGPMAKVLVREQAKSARNYEELRQKLAELIPTEAERRKFLLQSTRSKAGETQQSIMRTGESVMRSQVGPGATSASVAISQPVLDTVSKQLTELLGPIARVLVNRTAREANSVRDLYQRLSEQIPDEAQRANFLAKTPRQ